MSDSPFKGMVIELPPEQYDRAMAAISRASAAIGALRNQLVGGSEMNNIEVLKMVRDWYDSRSPIKSFPIDQVKDAIGEAHRKEKQYDSDSFGRSYGHDMRHTAGHVG